MVVLDAHAAGRQTGISAVIFLGSCVVVLPGVVLQGLVLSRAIWDVVRCASMISAFGQEISADSSVKYEVINGPATLSSALS